MRIMWYPKCSKEMRERFLEKLLELERRGVITLWGDQDENGKFFYDIREVIP
jgi:hypothetical protein